MRRLYTLKTEEYDRLINVLMDLAAYIWKLLISVRI